MTNACFIQQNFPSKRKRNFTQIVVCRRNKINLALWKGKPIFTMVPNISTIQTLIFNLKLNLRTAALTILEPDQYGRIPSLSEEIPSVFIIPEKFILSGLKLESSGEMRVVQSWLVHVQQTSDGPGVVVAETLSWVRTSLKHGNQKKLILSSSWIIEWLNFPHFFFNIPN